MNDASGMVRSLATPISHGTHQDVAVVEAYARQVLKDRLREPLKGRARRVTLILAVVVLVVLVEVWWWFR